MNENADKYLDELSRKVMSQSTVEQPSFDFTKSVIAQIENIGTSTVTTYTPLISKRIWVVIGLILASIFGVAIFGTSEENNSWLSHLRLDKLSEYSIQSPLSNFEYSQTMIYALMLFAIMMCVQIPILKHYFDKRLEV